VRGTRKTKKNHRIREISSSPKRDRKGAGSKNFEVCDKFFVFSLGVLYFRDYVRSEEEKGRPHHREDFGEIPLFQKWAIGEILVEKDKTRLVYLG